MVDKPKKLSKENKKPDKKDSGPNIGVYRFLAIFIIILLLLFAGVGGYYFFDTKKKSIEEYVSFAFLILGAVGFSIFIFYEFFSKKKVIGNAIFINELRKYHVFSFIMMCVLVLSFILSVLILLYYNFAEKPPLGSNYKRPCPYGTSSSATLKNPSEYS